MKSATLKSCIFVISAMVIFYSCQTETTGNFANANRLPKIYPDYINITVPYNIAPLNFRINEPGKSFEAVLLSEENIEILKIKSQKGVITFPEKKWKKILNKNQGKKLQIQVSCVPPDKNVRQKFTPFLFEISGDTIDPYLVYRVIHPGYYSWSNIKIEQRALTGFHTESLIENRMIEKNCVNCHSFNKNNPDEFLIHIRGSKGGTYFAEGNKIKKTNLKTETMPGGATYPAWHPGGRFVAFSSNQVRQSFYAQREKSIEVYDLISTLILYDKQTNEIADISTRDTINPMLTFPAWSPDGKYLYFCRGIQDRENTGKALNDIKNIHYNLVRKSFQENTQTFGEIETVFNAYEQNKSASFPRISPDGKFLVFTLQDYGTFPIWHEEADLYIIDLETNEISELNVNSNKTESYHCWSSNGKWLVFSSKRMDGRSARPFFAHIDSAGKAGKPFVLPQKDPSHYQNMLESFNIPELVSGKIRFSPRNFATAADQTAVQAKSDGAEKTWKLISNENNEKYKEKGIHE